MTRIRTMVVAFLTCCVLPCWAQSLDVKTQPHIELHIELDGKRSVIALPLQSEHSYDNRQAPVLTELSGKNCPKLIENASMDFEKRRPGLLIKSNANDIGDGRALLRYDFELTIKDAPRVDGSQETCLFIQPRLTRHSNAGTMLIRKDMTLLSKTNELTLSAKYVTP